MFLNIFSYLFFILYAIVSVITCVGWCRAALISYKEEKLQRG